MNIEWTEILVGGVVILPCLGIIIVGTIIAVILFIRKRRRQD